MKFTLGWLKRYLDTDASLEKICETLTAIGLEVEGVEDRAREFAPFKVALIEKAEQHPNADRLKVCSVKTADGQSVQVVCGAPNARAGMKGVFAPDGSYIPGLDVTLKATEIRGVKSNGMMVSEREMCLSDEHKGIIEVDDATPLGTPMASIFGLDDPVIEINVTPNRADCAGVYGIARDLAVAGLGTLKTHDKCDGFGDAFPCPVSVSIQDTDGCAHFMGRVVKNITNGPSPKWLQDLLKSVGLRPISTLVDITNFMTMTYARPLHVYDADKLAGGLVVKSTTGGETLDALNDKSYTVTDGAVGIYDDSGLIGLGGIVGGVSTAVDEKTRNVFIEAAYFNPMRIARAGRDLQINSDARYRFERGVDGQFTATGLDIATQMVIELCGNGAGQASAVSFAGTPPILPMQQTPIVYNFSMVEKIIGVDIAEARQREILTALGFEFSAGNKGSVVLVPPSWRGDVMGAADIVEEIIRIEGFDKIPVQSVCSGKLIMHNPETPLQSRVRTARHVLANRGLHESVTWSFMPAEYAALFGSNDNPALKLSNPISADLSDMRPSVLPNLLAAAVRNAARGYPDVALFEIGPVFSSPAPDGYAVLASGVRAGKNADRHWSDANAARAVDVYDAKADALAALEAIDAPTANAQITHDAPDYYHPGRSGALRLGKNVLAYFGELHPMVCEALDVKTPVVGFEVFLQNVPEPRRKGTEKTLLKLEDLQPLSRDFAFVVQHDIAADVIIRAALSADKNLITGVDIFDVYQGKGVPDGHKSVAISVGIQPRDGTLTDKDIETLMHKIIDAVVSKTGGTLRA